MALAVEVGEDSIPEHDDQEDPFVGAIVATKERLYIQAHEPVTREQFAKQFGLPAKTVLNHLSCLI